MHALNIVKGICSFLNINERNVEFVDGGGQIGSYVGYLFFWDIGFHNNSENKKYLYIKDFINQTIQKFEFIKWVIRYYIAF